MKTVSLELAKELKKNGFPKITEFYWTCPEGREEHAHLLRGFPPDEKNELYIASGAKSYVSPTADEILEKLPNKIYDKKEDWWFYLTVNKITDEEDCHEGWAVLYKEANGHLVFLREEEILLADACAKMWLYLGKGNLI